MNNIYHKLRESNCKSARILVRDILVKNKGNVSKTAQILGISRTTVRRARDGDLTDYSRKPKTSPKKISSDFESLILFEAKNTGYRHRRLADYFKKKYGLYISENTIKAVLKRNDVKPKRIRTMNRNRRNLYDYKHIEPFSQLQLDTKHILDKTALPKDVYEHIIRFKLPIYEWNIIDACTRTRFTAYSHKLNATFGFFFIIFVLSWLRTHNVRSQIEIQVDNGAEFCMGSKKKENEWNDIFSMFNAKLKSIPPGAKYLQALVENSHRKDDESFLSIHPIRCETDNVFLTKAQSWQDTWNTSRPSFGIEMNGMTPYEKLKSKSALISKHIFKFPVFLMESMLNQIGTAMQLFRDVLGIQINRKSGKYVYTTCQYSFF